jgi:hypothetical protein
MNDFARELTYEAISPTSCQPEMSFLFWAVRVVDQKLPLLVGQARQPVGNLTQGPPV